jgi:hypothetical protein
MKSERKYPIPKSSLEGAVNNDFNPADSLERYAGTAHRLVAAYRLFFDNQTLIGLGMLVDGPVAFFVHRRPDGCRGVRRSCGPYDTRHKWEGLRVLAGRSTLPLSPKMAAAPSRGRFRLTEDEPGGYVLRPGSEPNPPPFRLAWCIEWKLWGSYIWKKRECVGCRRVHTYPNIRALTYPTRLPAPRTLPVQNNDFGGVSVSFIFPRPASSPAGASRAGRDLSRGGRRMGDLGRWFVLIFRMEVRPFVLLTGGLFNDSTDFPRFQP